MLVHAVIECAGRTERRLVDSSDGVITIGRVPSCSLAIDSGLVSRKHVTVDMSGASMRVTDSSTNGTLAGDTFVRSSTAEVDHGAPIVIGDCTIWLSRAANDAAATTGAAPRRSEVPRPVTEMAMKRTTVPAPPPAGPAAAPHVAPALHVASAPPLVAPAPQIHLTPPHGLPPVSALAPVPIGVPSVAPAEPPRDRARQGDAQLRREIHKLLLDHLDLATVQPGKTEDPSLRPKVLNALRRIVRSLEERIPASVNRDELVGELADEALGLGPLERFLSDPTVNEIMVVDPDTIYIEQGGRLFQADARFTDDDRVRAVIERIVTPLGRRIDESSPLVDARLRDGSRVNAIIRPLALRGSAITIRKFSASPLTLDRLIRLGSMTEQMTTFLTRSVVTKKNIVISGGTGSGKTTLLNVLSGAIPSDERIVTIEDAAELQLRQPHVVSLETRPANMEGEGEYTIRDLVRNALRMRPDRIVVGECRGGEALDMLQAMNTGHEGSLTTLHANSAREAVSRLETLVLMSGVELPVRAIREQIAGSLDLIVQQSRFSDGSRRVTEIAEIVGIDDEGEVETVPLFVFDRSGTSSEGRVIGDFRSTGFLPTFLNEFIIKGLIKPGEAYL